MENIFKKNDRNVNNVIKRMYRHIFQIPALVQRNPASIPVRRTEQVQCPCQTQS